jgi:hypothetical protein
MTNSLRFWKWPLDDASMGFYGLFSLNKKPFYLHAKYSEKQDTWVVTGHQRLNCTMRVALTSQCYHILHTDRTQFTFAWDETRGIDDVVGALTNKSHVVEHSPVDLQLYTPKDPLLEWQKHADQYFHYLIKGMDVSAYATRRT